MNEGCERMTAYWLIPAEPALSFFVGVITELAGRYDAPAFEPHVTIYAAGGSSVSPEEILERVSSEWEPSVLRIRGIEWSADFTKTIYVQLEESDSLRRMSTTIQRASRDEKDYKLAPHLSLIYRTMDEAVKKEICSFINVPFSTIRFDSLQAVVVPATVTARRDIEAFRVAGARPLGLNS